MATRWKSIPVAGAIECGLWKMKKMPQRKTETVRYQDFIESGCLNVIGRVLPV